MRMTQSSSSFSCCQGWCLSGCCISMSGQHLRNEAETELAALTWQGWGLREPAGRTRGGTEQRIGTQPKDNYQDAPRALAFLKR